MAAVDDWVLQAVETLGRSNGASLREVQRCIDEKHDEELAIDTLQDALERLEAAEKLARHEDRWVALKKTNKEDAIKKLFNDD